MRHCKVLYWYNFQFAVRLFPGDEQTKTLRPNFLTQDSENNPRPPNQLIYSFAVD